MLSQYEENENTERVIDDEKIKISMPKTLKRKKRELDDFGFPIMSEPNSEV